MRYTIEIDGHKLDYDSEREDAGEHIYNSIYRFVNSQRTEDGGLDGFFDEHAMEYWLGDDLDLREYYISQICDPNTNLSEEMCNDISWCAKALLREYEYSVVYGFIRDVVCHYTAYIRKGGADTGWYFNHCVRVRREEYDCEKD